MAVTGWREEKGWREGGGGGGGMWWWWWGGGLVVMEGTLHEKNKTRTHTHTKGKTQTLLVVTILWHFPCQPDLPEHSVKLHWMNVISQRSKKKRKKKTSALFAVLTPLLDGSSFCVVSFPVYFPLVTLRWQFKLPPRRKTCADKSLKFQNIRGHFRKAPKTTECLKGELGVTLAEEYY